MADQDLPVVSVLMPVHNGAAFVRRALESLLDQTLTDWELVIIDDGSDDGTGDLLAPYLADPRCRHERFDRNRGLGAALNRALDLARAPLIAYLPADDVYYHEHLAALRACLEHTPTHHWPIRACDTTTTARRPGRRRARCCNWSRCCIAGPPPAGSRATSS